MDSEPKKFGNVALYLSGSMFGVQRYDCRTVTVTPGQKYAQYNNATKVEWLEKGKRKPRATMLTYKPWLRIVNLDFAIAVPDPMVDLGNGASRSRYGSCDARWVTDVQDLFEKNAVPVELAIGEELKPEPAEVEEEVS